jgi:hypothetical protein
MPHAEVMNVITSGAPQAQALLLGFAQMTPIQRQHLLSPLQKAAAAGTAVAAPAQPVPIWQQPTPLPAPPPRGARLLLPPPPYAPAPSLAGPAQGPSRVPSGPCFSCNQVGHAWRQCPRLLSRVVVQLICQ